MGKEEKYIPSSEEVKKDEAMMSETKDEKEKNKQRIFTEDVWKKNLEDVQQLKTSLKQKIDDEMSHYHVKAADLIDANLKQFTPAERLALIIARPFAHERYQKKIEKLDDLLYQEKIQDDIKRGLGNTTVEVEMKLYDLYDVTKALRKEMGRIKQQYMKDVAKSLNDKQIPTTQEIQDLQNKINDLQEKLEICDEVESHKI